MKKNPWIVAAVFFIVLAGVRGNLFAETEGPTPAGEAASVQGEVKATTPPEKTARVLKSGDPVFMGDKIETGADGQIQILLLDQTVFTLGPLSTITIDEFVYDPGKAGDKAGMVKGIFRAVAGKVSQKKPGDTPSGFSGDPASGADADTPGPAGASFSDSEEAALKLAELIGEKDPARDQTQKKSNPLDVENKS
jgi:hypothetical protein